MPRDRDGAKALAARLRARLDEIEEAVLTRVNAISPPDRAEDPEYAQGLRSAVSTALDYGLVAIEHGEERAPPPPVAILARARLAARSGVGIDTVLRRYCAGYALLGDFLISEAEQSGVLRDASLKRLLRAQAALLDHVLAVVGEEYMREASRPESQAQRRAERVRRLLDGELLDDAELGYELGGWHIGVVGRGLEAENALRDALSGKALRPLLLSREEQTIWGWLGSVRQPDPVEALEILVSSTPDSMAIAIGEPGKGRDGWRLSHRQALAALPIALRGGTRCVRYGDVALLAAALQDEILAASLRELYLEPLKADRDGGETARETISLYLEADRNASSTAAALGVKRHTVTNRLRAIEARIGRPLEACGADLEVAMRMAELEDVGSGATPAVS